MDIEVKYISLGQHKQVKVLKNDQISWDSVKLVLESKKFKDWQESFDPNGDLEVRSVKIDYIFLFGQMIGFVNLIVDCVTKSHQIRLPGFVFVRGKSVAVLVIANTNYMLLTRQFRVPAGKWLLEAPAGMIDESGHFAGVAAKELKEETGLDIDIEDLKPLGSFFPSPGGSDEEVLTYVTHQTLSEEKIKEITEKIHGEEHEQISIIIKEFNLNEISATQDAKLMCCALQYFNNQKASL